jgi:hypothetical protein
MDVGALVWLLVFVFVVALVYAGVRWMGVPIHPRLEQLMIGLVALIVLVVLVAWLLSLVGWSGHWMRGPRLP